MRLLITGAPGRSRTCDPQYRKLMLYPAELRVHLVGVVCVEGKISQTESIMVSLRETEVNIYLSFDHCPN